MNKMIRFLNRLEEAKIAYTLDKDRDFSITVLVYVPGERWEVDFLFENETEECSGVWVERFKSDGVIFDESELEVLFTDYAD